MAAENNLRQQPPPRLVDRSSHLSNLPTVGISKRWFKSQRARLDLLENYHGKIEKALTSVQAGQFLQIENQLGLFIDVAIASEMPTVGKLDK